MRSFGARVLRFRMLWIVLFAGITVFFASRLPMIEIESNIKSMLPDGMDAIVTLDRIEQYFGGTEMALVVLQTDDVLAAETLQRIDEISYLLEEIDGVERVLSLTTAREIRADDGFMAVNPAVPWIPDEPQAREELRSRLVENDIVYGTVVSHDFTVAGVIVFLGADADDDVVTAAVRAAVESTQGTEELFFGGLPFVRAEVAEDMAADMRRFIPLALAIMMGFLYLCFRRLRGVLLPFLVVIMSIIVAMGMLPILGWKIQLITVLLPVIMVAVTNDYGIHLLARYDEQIESLRASGTGGVSGLEITRDTLDELGAPIFITGVTTVAGMLCLMAHVVVPAAELGVLAAIGVLFALAASVLFLPSLLSYLPPEPRRHRRPRGPGLVSRLLALAAGAVTARPKRVLAAAVGIAAVAAIGIPLVVVDTNPIRYYHRDSLVARTSQVINSKLGGSTSVSVVVRGDMLEPGNLHRVEDLAAKIRALPDVGSTHAITDMVKSMSRALFDPGDAWYDRIPPTREAVAQYFELYSMSGDPDDFEKWVDFPFEHAHISGRLNTESSVAIKAVTDSVQDLTRSDDSVILVGGFAVIFAELVERVVTGQVVSLALSLFVVGLLVVLLFGSFAAGLLAALPLSMALLFLFGIMGYLKIELNVATAMLSSIMIGVGVDYTIHFLWRYREERRGQLSPEQAVAITLQSTGRGITFNALSVVVGFVVLVGSRFMPVQFFGYLVVTSILTCLLGALLVLPAICLLVRPRFLEPIAGVLQEGGIQ